MKNIDKNGAITTRLNRHRHFCHAACAASGAILCCKPRANRGVSTPLNGSRLSAALDRQNKNAIQS